MHRTLCLAAKLQVPEECFLMVQGEYQVKFQVDGEWRLAPEWPLIRNEDGSENNMLVVD